MNNRFDKFEEIYGYVYKTIRIHTYYYIIEERDELAHDITMKVLQDLHLLKGDNLQAFSVNRSRFYQQDMLKKYGVNKTNKISKRHNMMVDKSILETKFNFEEIPNNSTINESLYLDQIKDFFCDNKIFTDEESKLLCGLYINGIKNCRDYSIITGIYENKVQRTLKKAKEKILNYKHYLI